MDKILKEKWVAALRSGKYKQGKEMLKNKRENTFCCLGVLCDVANPNGWAIVGGVPGDYFEPVGSSYSFRENKERFGLSMRDAKDLMNMNDIDSKSFAEIADYIEKNIETT